MYFEVEVHLLKKEEGMRRSARKRVLPIHSANKKKTKVGKPPLKRSRNGNGGGGIKRKMRLKSGQYDNYIRRMCRALNVPLPKQDVMHMLGQSLELVMVECMKNTNKLMGTRKRKVTPEFAKRGIMSYFRQQNVKQENIKMVLKMCDDTHKMLQKDE